MADVAALKAERARRARLPKAAKAIEASLFTKQREVIQSTSRRRVLAAGRRGGKTDLLGKMAILSALRFPSETVPILEKAMTTQAAKAMWRMLRALDDLYSLGAEFHETHKRMTMRNGSVIELVGIDTADAADKIRGGRYPLVILDEAGTIRPSILAFLIDEVVEPALLDYNGAFIMAGTPNLTKKGPFYEAFAGTRGGYERFNWDIRDNPALPLVDLDKSPEERYKLRVASLEEILATKKWTWTTPQFVREYLGQWSETTGGGVFQYSPALNLVPRAPRGEWSYFLATDIGFNDDTVFVVWGRRKHDPYLYVLHVEEHQKMTPSRFADRTKALIGEYGFFHGMVADTGGAGKGYVEQARETYGIAYEPAQKRDKLANIMFCNDDLGAGRIKLVEGTTACLAEDLGELPWNEEGTDYSPNHHEHSHTADAFLYGHRYVSRWNHVTPAAAPLPVPGSRAAWQREAELMEEREEKEHAKALRPLDGEKFLG